MRIVLATDGSESATAAARFLLRWPLGDARVDVVSVAEWGTQPVTPDEDEEPDTALASEMSAQMESATTAVASMLSPHCARVETMCLRGDPSVQIVGHAEDIGADLIVVGSHGRRGVSRFLLGSVSYSVVTTSRCSVLVVRGDGGAGPVDVVLGLDGSIAAMAAVDRLAGTTPGCLGTLRVVTVMLLVKLYRRDILQKLSASFQVRKAVAARRLSEAAARLRVSGVASEVSECLAEAENAAEELLAEASKSGADLVVVGDSERRDLKKIVLGSVAARVLSHASVSVWIEKCPEPSEGAGGLA